MPRVKRPEQYICIILQKSSLRHWQMFAIHPPIFVTLHKIYTTSTPTLQHHAIFRQNIRSEGRPLPCGSVQDLLREESCPGDRAPAGSFDPSEQKRTEAGQKKKTASSFFCVEKTIVNKSNTGKLDIATETTENVSYLWTNCPEVILTFTKFRTPHQEFTIQNLYILLWCKLHRSTSSQLGTKLIFRK